MGKLFVGNIPRQLSENDLQQWIETRGFSVEGTEIIRDRRTGRSRGFGFVVLKEQLKIRQAIASLSGQKIAGNIVTVLDTCFLKLQ